MASLLVARVPPQDWPDVTGAPDKVEKALWEVWETLEYPSAGAAMGPACCMFLSALRTKMETALHDVVRVPKL